MPGFFFLTFFTFCYFLLLFLLLVTFVNYFLLLKVHCLLLLFTFLLLATFINYFLLLRGAKGIILLYLFIFRGEGVRLDFFIFKFFLPLRGRGGTSNCFFFPSFDMWREEGTGLSFFLKTPKILLKKTLKKPTTSIKQTLQILKEKILCKIQKYNFKINLKSKP